MRTYSKEFKEELVKRIEEVGNIAFLSKVYDVPESTLRGWQKKGSNANYEDVKKDIVKAQMLRKELNDIKELKEELIKKDMEINILRNLLREK